MVIYIDLNEFQVSRWFGLLNFLPAEHQVHPYPPDLQEEAVKTVLMQAELLCADWV